MKATINKPVVLALLKTWKHHNGAWTNLDIKAFRITGETRVPKKGEYFVNACPENNEQGDAMFSTGGMKGRRDILVEIPFGEFAAAKIG